MSTILNALKKVEGKRETISVKTEIPRALKSPVSDESRIGIKKKYTVIVLLLVLTAGAIAGYRFWPSPEKSEVTQNSGDDSKVSINLAEKSATVVPTLPEEQVQVTETIEPVTGLPANSTEEPEFRLRTFNQIKPELLAQKRSFQEPAFEPESPKPRQTQGGPNTDLDSNPSSQTASDVETSAAKSDIPILQDRSLEIQALVYSSYAAKRMIVLNGEILRQGADYKGYIIERIESQRVIVRKNGAVSALPFGK